MLQRAALRPHTGIGGTWRGWGLWLWRQLAAVGAARYRARMVRGHGRY